MSDLKTQENDGNVEDYLKTVEPQRRQADSFTLLDMMIHATELPPRMWGDSIVGFGAYDYTYESGRSGRWFLTGFAPRKAAMSIYIMPGFNRYGSLLERLGTYKTSASCLYVTRLANVDMAVLEELVKTSVADMRRIYDA